MKAYIGPYNKTEQKTEVTIDDYDTYSVDHTLAKIIEPLLIKFATYLLGAPLVDNEDVPVELWRPEGWEGSRGEVDPSHHKRWDWVINEMIWAFHQKNHDWEEQYYSGESDVYFEDADEEGYGVMRRGPDDTFSVDHAAMKVHQERMSNGFRLFGKYYEKLWS